MAKPDCDDGWLKYAHELDAALAVADFSKGARIVLREVFAQIFGLSPRPRATLSASAIARRSGLKQPNVSRAIRELMEAGVLHRESDGSYRFLKGYWTWTTASRGGSARAALLTPVEVAYCQSAPSIAKAYQHGYDETAYIQRDIASTNADDAPISNEIWNHIQRDIAPISNGICAEASPYRNAREEEIKKEEEASQGAATPPPFPHEDGPLDIWPGPFELTREQSESTWLNLWRSFGNLAICNGFYERQRGHSSDTWGRAIRRVVRRGKKISSIGYLDTIAGDIEANGDREDERPARASPRKAKPIEYFKAPPDQPELRKAKHR